MFFILFNSWQYIIRLLVLHLDFILSFWRLWCFRKLCGVVIYNWLNSKCAISVLILLWRRSYKVLWYLKVCCVFRRFSFVHLKRLISLLENIPTVNLFSIIYWWKIQIFEIIINWWCYDICCVWFSGFICVDRSTTISKVLFEWLKFIVR